MGIRVDLAHRLRQLDVEVEHLRAALEALQRQLGQPPARVARVAVAGPGDAEEYLRAYA